MNTSEILTTSRFLEVLVEMHTGSKWKRVRSRKSPLNILLQRKKKTAKPYNYLPLGAVYFHLTGKHIENCFLMPEVTEELLMPEHEVVAISYASGACDCSRQYNRPLRQAIIKALRKRRVRRGSK